MSHFYVLALVPTDDLSVISDHNEVYSVLSDLLAPYDENITVDEYDTECYCVGKEAEHQARKQCEAQLGTFDALRDRYWARVDAMIPQEIILKGGEKYYNARDEASEKISWEDHISHFIKLEKDLTKQHAMYGKPDPKCEECDGTGTHPSTYNPKSKWDWYSIGGRWSGVLDDYNPADDPNNVEQCWLCNGTGMRNDALGQQERLKNPDYTCNGCSGKGSKTKWPTDWKQYSGDIQPSDKVASLIKANDQHCPYALVTSDGQWHERGQMGWFGMSSNDMDQNEWREAVVKMLEDSPNTVAVVVDCHI
jgi:hypothetical protein